MKTNRFFKYGASLLLLFLLLSCDKPQKVIVLCDTSNSTTLLQSKIHNSGRLDELKGFVRKIPLCYPLKTEFYFFPVSQNVLSKPLSGCKVMYDIEEKQQIDSEKEKVDLQIKLIEDELVLNAKNAKNSCILSSIYRAIRAFDKFEKSARNTNELIIISDMLECCGETEVNLNTFRQDEFERQIINFEKNNPKLDVKKLNLIVTVIVNSPGMGQNYKIIEEKWREWFSKIGVMEENLHFYISEFPKDEDPELLELYGEQ